MSTNCVLWEQSIWEWKNPLHALNVLVHDLVLYVLGTTAFPLFKPILKHTTTLISLSDHYILSREWRVIVDTLQTDYHGRPMVLKISQVWPSCWLWGILIMFGCVLSQLKPAELYILSCEKSLGLRPRPFSQLWMLSSSGFILYINNISEILASIVTYVLYKFAITL